MPRLHLFVGVFLLLAIVLAACASETPMPGTVMPVEDTVQASPTQTLAPINLGGPEMAVGSTWLYADGTRLVAVPGSLFMMGRDDGTDNPAHEVMVSEFWMYSTKVTNQQYARCVAAGECTFPGNTEDYEDDLRANEPVHSVNWNQAAAYCEFVKGRLPTEAEWEKAARGTQSNIYPWGDEAPSCALLNFNNCIGRVTNVTFYPQGQSFFGALDMAGNAYEWVADWYDPFYYRASPTQDPPGAETGDRRSVRSSSYKSNADQAPSFTRFFDFPENHSRDRGFRCVVIDPDTFAPACSLAVAYGHSGSPGSELEANCSALDIKVQPLQCDTNKTNVTFSSNDSSAVYGGVDACIPGVGSFPGNVLVTCTSPTTATLDGVCTLPAIGQAHCPVHYELDAGTGICTWDGSITGSMECLPGDTYDPVNQCCVSASGNIGELSLCEAGSELMEISPGVYGCLGSALTPPHPHLEAYVGMPAACGGPTCTLTCGACKILDTSTCTCKPDPNC
jgi:formylglycine-generating enzyme required for sulfatase activity